VYNCDAAPLPLAKRHPACPSPVNELIEQGKRAVGPVPGDLPRHELVLQENDSHCNVVFPAPDRQCRIRNEQQAPQQTERAFPSAAICIAVTGSAGRGLGRAPRRAFLRDNRRRRSAAEVD
jgi:hypothetical protein